MGGGGAQSLSPTLDLHLHPRARARVCRPTQAFKLLQLAVEWLWQLRGRHVQLYAAYAAARGAAALWCDAAVAYLDAGGALLQHLQLQQTAARGGSPATRSGGPGSGSGSGAWGGGGDEQLAARAAAARGRLEAADAEHGAALDGLEVGRAPALARASGGTPRHGDAYPAPRPCRHVHAHARAGCGDTAVPSAARRAPPLPSSRSGGGRVGAAAAAGAAPRRAELARGVLHRPGGAAGGCRLRAGGCVPRRHRAARWAGGSMRPAVGCSEFAASLHQP